MKRIKAKGVKVVIYEPLLKESQFFYSTVVKDLSSFKSMSDVIVTNRMNDELNDVVAELVMAKPDQWLVKLASGQVWRQTHPRRLNLREGDAVRIYPTGWGENFRLEAVRLNGFIQVLRVE